VAISQVRRSASPGAAGKGRASVVMAFLGSAWSGRRDAAALRR
jgi:hypothetical protein